MATQYVALPLLGGAMTIWANGIAAVRISHLYYNAEQQADCKQTHPMGGQLFARFLPATAQGSALPARP